MESASDKFRIHNKALGIEENAILGLFADLIERCPNARLECSCKIKQHQVYPARFNLHYQGGDHQENLRVIDDFLGEVSNRSKANMNFQLREEAMGKDIDFDKVRGVITGIDLRDNRERSRAKLWFVIADWPEKKEAILSLHELNNEHISKITAFRNKLLFGFDLFFDGRTRLKIYPRLYRKDLKDGPISECIKKLVSPEALELLDKSRKAYISFKDGIDDPVLQFVPLDPDEFVRTIKNETVTQTLDLLPDRIKVIALNDAEIKNEQIDEINLYY